MKPLQMDIRSIVAGPLPQASTMGTTPTPAFVMVHADARLSLATDQLLLPPDQAPAFADALALAEALDQLRSSEQARVQAAVAAGRAQGLAEGRTQGLAEAHHSAATELATSLQRLQQQQADDAAALQQQVVALALLVVRRVAAGLAPEAVVAALARQAFEHLAAARTGAPTEADSPAWQGCQLRVHPALLADVQQQLGPTPGLRLVADEQLAPLDCVLDTPGGRLLAGLETQLTQVRARLAQAPQPHPTAAP
jgi:type III secretion protein L